MSATEDLSPVAVEAAIRECSNRIAKGVAVCADRQSALLRAEHAYDVAYARAYLEAADQPAHARKYIAELATAEERSARDVAEVAYRHAERQAKALDSELRSWQSINASIRTQFGVAGVVER
jgi:nucleotide-binding universal stress UspA family protein